MRNKFISVIVPVYNAEKYLFECVDSILHQTYRDFELLLIDDGSSDESLKICNDFKEKDSRVKVYHHENKGVSYTRNRGIALSAGEYIAFVDADDLILPQYLEKLLGVVRLSNFPEDMISFCRFYDLLSNNKRVEHIEKYDNLKNGKQSLSLTVADIFSAKLFGSICRMLIPSALVKSNGVFFPNCLAREDQLFLFDLINYSDRFVECNEYLYIYRYNTDSTTRVRYIKNFIVDQSQYLDTFQKKLGTYDLDDVTTKELFEYDVLNVKILWLVNAARSENFFEELKNIKTSEYYEYPVEKHVEKRWFHERYKTAKIVYVLAKMNLYFISFLFLKLKGKMLKRI